MNNRQYLTMEYQRGTPKKLEIGDSVIVHPAIRPDGTPSTAREPFEAKIILMNDTMVYTSVPGRHSALINEYLFNRLEFKGR